MSGLSDSFLQKIATALQDEEVDVYTLALYSLNTNDLNYFSEADRKKVAKIFKTLMEDTRHHMEILKMIVELGAK